MESTNALLEIPQTCSHLSENVQVNLQDAWQEATIPSYDLARASLPGQPLSNEAAPNNDLFLPLIYQKFLREGKWRILLLILGLWPSIGSNLMLLNKAMKGRRFITQTSRRVITNFDSAVDQ